MENITRRSLAGILGSSGLYGVPKIQEEEDLGQLERDRLKRAGSKLTGIPVELVKVSRWSLDTCGCVIDHVWDVATLYTPELREHHCLGVERCNLHQKLTQLKAYSAICKENRLKNNSVVLAAQHIYASLPEFPLETLEIVTLGVEGAREALKNRIHGALCSIIRWSFGADRALSLSLPDHYKQHVEEITAKLREAGHSVEVA